MDEIQESTVFYIRYNDRERNNWTVKVQAIHPSVVRIKNSDSRWLNFREI
jgi:hypothetical protein